MEPEDEAPPPPGTACPECGTSFDPDVDFEGCETCRQRALAQSEAEEDIAPDPDEVAHVRKMQRFLATPGDPELRYCPGCLAEFLAGTKACEKCTKELLSHEELRAHAMKSIADVAARWFVPLIEDAPVAMQDPGTAKYVVDTIEKRSMRGAHLAERMFAALDADESAPVLELRVHRDQKGFSAIFGVWREYRATYFVRRNQLPALREWLGRADLGGEYAEAQAALLTRIDTLLDPNQA
jgi:hypothetical protein